MVPAPYPGGAFSTIKAVTRNTVGTGLAPPDVLQLSRLKPGRNSRLVILSPRRRISRVVERVDVRSEVSIHQCDLSSRAAQFHESAIKSSDTDGRRGFNLPLPSGEGEQLRANHRRGGACSAHGASLNNPGNQKEGRYKSTLFRYCFSNPATQPLRTAKSSRNSRPQSPGRPGPASLPAGPCKGHGNRSCTAGRPRPGGRRPGMGTQSSDRP